MIKKEWVARDCGGDHHDATTKFFVNGLGNIQAERADGQGFGTKAGMSLAVWLIAQHLKKQGKAIKDVEIIIR